MALALAWALAGTAARGQTSARVRDGRAAQEAHDDARARGLYTEASRSVDAREAAEGHYFLASLADEALDFPTALTEYRASVAGDPSSRYAARALARIDDLAEHAEGGFAPLVALERVRRDPRRADDPREIAALETTAGGFPPGRVRAEARLLVADAYFGRLDRPRDAARVFLALAGDTAAPRDVRDLAAARLVEARGRLGEESLAVREVTSLRADAGVQRNARVRARRVVLHRVALVSVTLTALAGVLALVLAVRRGAGRRVLRAWARPLPLAHIGMLTVGGALLAKSYDGHEGAPFYALGGGTLAVYLAATAWSVAGSTHGLARAVRGVACGIAVLAVAYLAMEILDPMMLEGINL